MGIRFACHVCDHSLNIKHELAGRIGVCPKCRGRFRIPLSDTDKSLPVDVADESQSSSDLSAARSAPTATAVRPAVKAAAIAASTVPATTNASAGPGPRNESPLDEPLAQWYVRPPAGGQYGPATGEIIRSWIRENRVTPSTLIWRDGWPQWRSAREVLPELADATSIKFSASPGTATHDNPLLNDPLQATGPVAFKSNAKSLVGDPVIGQLRSTRNQRRLILIVSLALLSVFLILTLVYLATRPV